MTGIFQYPKNLKKYPGTIIEYKSKFVFIVYKNGSKHIITEIKFGKSKTKESAKDERITYKKNWGIQNNLVKNKYYINNNNLNIYLGKSTWFKADLSDLKFIDNHIWTVSRGKYLKYAITLLPIKERKNKNKKEYIKYHQYLYKNNKNKNNNLSFINNNTLDNRKSNIQYISKNIFLPTKKIRKDNTSGHTCIFRGNYKEYEYWQVKGKNSYGKKIYKKFSINKYGENKAKELAINYKINFIDNSFIINQTKNDLCLNHI